MGLGLTRALDKMHPLQSYGKIEVSKFYYQTKERYMYFTPLPNEVQAQVITCEHCGDRFTAKSRRGAPKYCPKCKTHETNERQRQRRAAAAKPKYGTCVKCGGQTVRKPMQSGRVPSLCDNCKENSFFCGVCGAHFVPQYNTQQCCSKACQQELGGRKSAERGVARQAERAYTCKNCGKQYTAKV